MPVARFYGIVKPRAQPFRISGAKLLNRVGLCTERLGFVDLGLRALELGGLNTTPRLQRSESTQEFLTPRVRQKVAFVKESTDPCLILCSIVPRRAHPDQPSSRSNALERASPRYQCTSRTTWATARSSSRD